jgi:hypothetical protein
MQAAALEAVLDCPAPEAHMQHLPPCHYPVLPPRQLGKVRIGRSKTSIWSSGPRQSPYIGV